jgi:hypothetical protein
MKALLLVMGLTVPAAAAPVTSIIAVPGQGYTVNGVQTQMLGFGSFKDVVVHPANQDLVVKVFPGRMGSNGIQEKRWEVYALKKLEPIGATPKLVEAGAVSLNGTHRGMPAGYMVQERVHGQTIEDRPSEEAKILTRNLFERLKKAGVELVDAENIHKMRQNIMVGDTASGGRRSWLVDPDIRESDKSAAQLAAYYDGLHTKLFRR